MVHGGRGLKCEMQLETFNSWGLEESSSRVSNIDPHVARSLAAPQIHLTPATVPLRSTFSNFDCRQEVWQ